MKQDVANVYGAQGQVDADKGIKANANDEQARIDTVLKEAGVSTRMQTTIGNIASGSLTGGETMKNTNSATLGRQLGQQVSDMLASEVTSEPSPGTGTTSGGVPAGGSNPRNR